MKGCHGTETLARGGGGGGGSSSSSSLSPALRFIN